MSGEKTTSRTRRAIAASIVGNTLEWYDYFLYGTASALIFGELFFPLSDDPEMRTLASFAGYAAGFIARPFGGILFGNIGDRLGHRYALMWTLGIMGAATFLIGLLPTYATAGIWAPILLIALRLAQATAAAGEWGGGILIIVDTAPPHRRGLYSAMSQIGTSLGFLLSSVMFFLAQHLTGDDFLRWGWRVPFLIGIVMFGAGLWIRACLHDIGGAASASKKATRAPVVELFRRQGRALAQCVIARFAELGCGNIVMVFSFSYAKMQGATMSVIMTAGAISIAATIVAIPVWAHLSDLFGRRSIYLVGTISMALLAYPFFQLMGSGSSLFITLALVAVNVIASSAMIGVMPAMYAEMFDQDVRYSGLSLAHEISAILVGTSPFVATALLAYYDSITPVVIFMILLCIASTIAVITMRLPPYLQQSEHSNL